MKRIFQILNFYSPFLDTVYFGSLYLIEGSLCKNDHLWYPINWEKFFLFYKNRTIRRLIRKRQGGGIWARMVKSFRCRILWRKEKKLEWFWPTLFPNISNLEQLRMVPEKFVLNINYIRNLHDNLINCNLMGHIWLPYDSFYVENLVNTINFYFSRWIWILTDLCRKSTDMRRTRNKGDQNIFEKLANTVIQKKIRKNDVLGPWLGSHGPANTILMTLLKISIQNKLYIC